MDKKEKFSVGKSVENIEAMRLESGMIALYPELWGEIEKEHKDALLEAVIKEINYALDKEEYGYAVELAEDLYKHFGRGGEKQKGEKAGPMVLPGKRVVRTIDEVRHGYKAPATLGYALDARTSTERAVSGNVTEIKPGDSAQLRSYPVPTAEQMKEFGKPRGGALNPKDILPIRPHTPPEEAMVESGEKPENEFEKGVRSEANKTWAYTMTGMRREVRLEAPDPWAVIVAADLRQFDKERFDSDMGEANMDKLWASAAKRLPELNNSASINYWVEMASALKRLDAERFSQEISLDEGDLSNIVKLLKRHKTAGDVFIFVRLYNQASDLFGQDRLARELPITLSDWEDLSRPYLANTEDHPRGYERLKFSVLANSIRPEGAAPLKIDRPELDKERVGLGYIADRGHKSTVRVASALIEAEKQIREQSK